MSCVLNLSLFSQGEGDDGDVNADADNALETMVTEDASHPAEDDGPAHEVDSFAFGKEENAKKKKKRQKRAKAWPTEADYKGAKTYGVRKFCLFFSTLKFCFNVCFFSFGVDLCVLCFHVCHFLSAPLQ